MSSNFNLAFAACEKLLFCWTAAICNESKCVNLTRVVAQEEDAS